MFHPVKEPRHYAGDGKVACMDALRSMMSNVSNLAPIVVYWWGCAFKYLWRWPHKNGQQDIEKCIQCLKYLKDELGESNNDSQS